MSGPKALTYDMKNERMLSYCITWCSLYCSVVRACGNPLATPCAPPSPRFQRRCWRLSLSAPSFASPSSIVIVIIIIIDLHRQFVLSSSSSHKDRQHPPLHPDQLTQQNHPNPNSNPILTNPPSIAVEIKNDLRARRSAAKHSADGPRVLDALPRSGSHDAM